MNRAAGTAPILLDTHHWIWLQLGAENEFTEKAHRAVESAAGAGSLRRLGARLLTRDRQLIQYGGAHHVGLV